MTWYGSARDPIASERSLLALRTARRFDREGSFSDAAAAYRIAADSLKEERNDLALEAQRRARYLERIARIQQKKPTLRTSELRERARPGARIVGYIGDINWPTYDGGPIYRNVGRKGYTLEYILPPEDPDDRRARWEVYQVDLDPTFWDWADLTSVAGTIGTKTASLRRSMRSRDPFVLANLAQDIAANYGWHELDSQPLRLTRSQVWRRYRRRP